MQYITKLRLAAVHQLCDANDKSTEFMLQYMQDTCKVDLDCVMLYMKLHESQKQKLFQEVNSFVDLFILLDI